MNYLLRSIPARDNNPLKYTCRDNDKPDPTPHGDFLDDVAMAPLNGDSFTIDTAQFIPSWLTVLLATTPQKPKIQGLQQVSDGRKRLVEHYEGVGIHATDI